MINKKEFDLLLQEIFQIENKIEEIKILNQFDKANEYENALEKIRIKAKEIKLDNENKLEGFDDLSIETLTELILLHSDIDYYILTENNMIETSNENQIDPAVLRKIKELWNTLENDIKNWNNSKHNPIEDLEFYKNVGKTTFDIIIYQLEKEGVLDLSRVFKYCKREFLENAIKETLYEGAKEETKDEIRRRKLVNSAKDMSEKRLYDYKLWQDLLMIKNTRSRDDHIEIIGNPQEKDNRKYIIDENYENKSASEDTQMLYEEYDSIFSSLKKWLSNLNENANQKSMIFSWKTSKGPAFKYELENGSVKYAKKYIDKNTVSKIKKIIIASNGVAKYHFENASEWKNLESLAFLSKKASASVNLSPDRVYNCIGTEAFENCAKLSEISFGKIEIIGERAFQNCTNLTNLIFPEGLMNIGEDAFLGCSNLSKITFLGTPKIYIADRPQNVLNCFKGTSLQEITFYDIESAFNFVVIDCPNLKNIFVSKIPGISIPFKTCKYRLGRQEGIASFVGEKALTLWKKRNNRIRFFELTEEDKRKYNF